MNTVSFFFFGGMRKMWRGKCQVQELKGTKEEEDQRKGRWAMKVKTVIEEKKKKKRIEG